MEFVATMILFVILLTALLASATNRVPEFTDQVDETQLNTEAERISTYLMTNPGETNINNKDWHNHYEDNNQELTSIGLAATDAGGNAQEFHLQREKIEALTNQPDDDDISYQEFRELIDNIENQYRFTFTWLPIIETQESFRRGESPDYIFEPDDSDPDTFTYDDVDDQVHFGTTNINGAELAVLVVAEDGVYNRIYPVQTTDGPPYNFEDSGQYQEGQTLTIGITPEDFEIKNFQNRDNEPGAAVYLEREIKDYGALIDQESTVIKYDRYAVLEDSASDDHPLLIEVFAW